MSRRYRVPALDFDTRSHILKQEIGELWDCDTKKLWQNNKLAITDSLKYDFGEKNLEMKIKNFCDIGAIIYQIVFTLVLTMK